MKIIPKIKKRPFFWGILFALLLIGIVYAAESYRVNSGTQVTINEWSVCKKVTNSNASDIFVPTKTEAEWTAFRTNASGVTYAECCTCGSYGVCGSCSYGSTCTCSGSGTQTRTCTPSGCDVESQSCPCTRTCPTVSCGTTTYGTCGSCNYASTCATSGPGTQSVTSYTCNGSGSCVTNVGSQSCTCTRGTDGIQCATCKACSSGSCNFVGAGIAGYGCTGTHYRCDGNGNCTAPCSVLSKTCVVNGYIDCNVTCANGGFCGCANGQSCSTCSGCETSNPCQGSAKAYCNCYNYSY